MDLICDANVWYDFQRKKMQPSSFKSQGHRLLVGPLTYLEIVSKLDEQNFAQRREVCKIITDECDDILNTTDSHLATLWGFEAPAEPIAWRPAIESVARASSLDELSTGLKTVDETAIEKTNVSMARDLRDAKYSLFCQNVETVLARFCNGYKTARDAGQAISVNKATGQLFLDAVRQPGVHRRLVSATFDRVRSLLKDPSVSIPEQQVELVHTAIHSYIAVYCEFLHDCLTRKPPEPNDLGDIENFLYLQDGRRLLTSEKRWHQHAATAGVGEVMYVP